MNVCKNILSLAIAGWLLGFAAPAAADPFAYVTSLNFSKVKVIDTVTETVVDTVVLPFGSASDVAVTPDGAFLYVTSDDFLNIGNVFVIDTATNTVVDNVTVGERPAGVA